MRHKAKPPTLPGGTKPQGKPSSSLGAGCRLYKLLCVYARSVGQYTVQESQISSTASCPCRASRIRRPSSAVKGIWKRQKNARPKAFPFISGPNCPTECTCKSGDTSPLIRKPNITDASFSARQVGSMSKRAAHLTRQKFEVIRPRTP